MSARRLPAEWEPQSGIMLTWPHQHSDWHDTLFNVEPVFIEISCHICETESVLIVAFDDAHARHISATLNKAKVSLQNISFASIPSNDVWARDHGPISILENNRLLLLDFTFNGWGGKYPATLDNKINSHLFESGTFPRSPLISIDFVLEGGSIESDGNGTILTTTHCLLSQMRNATPQKQVIEQKLKELLGATRILWLTEGMLMGDDTDGHIDTLARFCNANTILYTQCLDEQDVHFESLNKMELELMQMRTADERPYNLVPIPLPPAVFSKQKNNQNQRLPATYANFLIINNAVLLPIYNLPTDNDAINIVQQCFPDHRIIPINCLPLIEQHGSLHCVTMQFPAGALAEMD